MELQNPRLRQRGRASLDFLALLGKQSGIVREQVGRDLQAAGIAAETLPADIDAAEAAIETALAASPAYAVQNFLGDWHGRSHGPISVEAFVEIEPELQPVLAAHEQGPASLTLDPAMPAPEYWEGVEFHRTSGGWEGHPHMGFVHGELIHKKMVARVFPGGIFGQRRTVAAMAPRASYRRILDMGCSSGHFTTALQETYPGAEIVGIDLSARMLEHALRTANANGWAWQLHQMNAEHTSFAAESFDLVTSYIVFHEAPAAAIANIIAEAFRVLEPGGDMLMSDVTRYADLDPLSRWKADRGASLGGEPHWRESASLDFKAMAEAAGFVDVRAQGLYPHVLIGRKPAR
jgi:SAM-dependent methyltransferase